MEEGREKATHGVVCLLIPETLLWLVFIISFAPSAQRHSGQHRKISGGHSRQPTSLLTIKCSLILTTGHFVNSLPLSLPQWPAVQFLPKILHINLAIHTDFPKTSLPKMPDALISTNVLQVLVVDIISRFPSHFTGQQSLKGLLSRNACASSGWLRLTSLLPVWVSRGWHQSWQECKGSSAALCAGLESLPHWQCGRTPGEAGKACRPVYPCSSLWHIVKWHTGTLLTSYFQLDVIERKVKDNSQTCGLKHCFPCF